MRSGPLGSTVRDVQLITDKENVDRIWILITLGKQTVDNINLFNILWKLTHGDCTFDNERFFQIAITKKLLSGLIGVTFFCLEILVPEQVINLLSSYSRHNFYDIYHQSSGAEILQYVLLTLTSEVLSTPSFIVLTTSCFRPRSYITIITRELTDSVIIQCCIYWTSKSCTIWRYRQRWTRDYCSVEWKI